MDSQHNTSSFMSRELSGNPAIWESEWMSAWWQGLLEGKSSGLEGIGIWEDQFVNDSLLSSTTLGDIGAEDEGRNGAATDNEALFDLNQPVGLRPDWLIGRLQQPDWGQILAAQSAAAEVAQPQVVVSEVVVESNGAQPPAAAAGDGTTPPASQSSAASAGQPIRYEVEDWTLSDYRTEALSFASGGESIRITAASGSATTTFNEPTGRYMVVAGFFDESDGVSSASLDINGQTLASWQFDDSAGGDGPTAGNLREVTLGSDVQLSQGDTLTLLGTQGNWEYARVDYIDFIPVASGITVNATLGNDTGTSNSDGLTNDSTITGSVGDVANLATLQARLDRDGVYVDITDLVQPDGSFSLSLDNLNNDPGNVFNDGAYTVDLVATDTSGNTSAPVAVTFSLDRTTPELTLTSPLISGDNDGRVRLVGSATEGGTLSISVDGAPPFNPVIQENFSFDVRLQEQPLTPGTHQLTLNFTDIAGNVSQSTVNFTVADNGNGGGVDVSTDELVMHLAFDETSGTAASDSSPFGNDNDGTLVNGASFVDSGTALQGAVRFDGNNDYVAVATANDINGSPVNQRTISAWFKVDDKAISSRKQVIFETGGTRRGFNMYIDGGQLYVGGWHTDENWNGTYLSTGAISSDTWHHVTLVLDASNSNSLQSGAFRAYLDGTAFGSGDGVRIVAHNDPTGIGAINTATRFHTGQVVASGSDGLAGSVADVKLYNRVLSTDEIASLANALTTTDPFALSASLANDTGASNSDGITTDATIAGSVGNASALSTLQARLGDSGDYVEITSAVQADGSFSLGLDDLIALQGGALIDGSYRLTLLATDTGGTTSGPTTIDFTLDRSGPTLTLKSPIGGGDHTPAVHLLGDVDEAGNLTVSLNGGSLLDLNLAAGEFDQLLQSLPLSPGAHQLALSFTDVAGNATETTLDFNVTNTGFQVGGSGTQGWSARSNETVILGESDSYVVQATQLIDLGQTEGSRTLRFAVNAAFDGSDTSSTSADQLAVYLVDPSNPTQTLLDGGQPGTPVFSLAGEQAEFIAGQVRFDGQFVEIDLTSLADQSQGLLVFQLLNQDGDDGTRVVIEDLSNQVDPDGLSSPVFVNNPTLVTAGGDLNLGSLSLSNDIEVHFSDVRFDAASGQYRATVQLHNDGTSDVGRNVAVVFANLPDGITLQSPSGTDGSGNGYINFRSAIRPGGLTAGSVSDGIEISFSNPDQLRVALQPQVLVGGPNQAPIFETVEPITVLPGGKVKIELAATDPDGDRVTFSLRGDDLPNGKLDGAGNLIFEPRPDQVGTYDLTLVASDGVEEVTQTVSLTVAPDPITTTRISGRILDINRNPLANLPLELGRLQTVTDAEGYFTFTLPDSSIPTEEINIQIPLGDPAFDPFMTGEQVINLRRTTFDGATGTGASNPLRHPNLVTTFMDGSMVYGSDATRADALRTLDGTGRLKVSTGDLLPLNNTDYFAGGPLANNNRSLNDPSDLFAAGDVRANENIGLTSLHTVFVREHNRLADEIRTANPALSGDEVYERARKLVSAQVQHITYQEYLPLLLGDGAISSYSGYDSSVDPAISHLFSAAAFRMGHTQSFDEFLLIDETGQALPSVTLRESTFNPAVIQQYGVDAILRGLFAQSAEAIDLKVLDELRNTLFGPPGSGGIDLAAVDIERGRDVGLPDYNQARIDFGLPPVTSFAEISSDPDIQAALEAVYGDVNNIDVIVGGLAEDKAAGAMVGELFQTIMVDQFVRLRDGDRFWYENGQFTQAELDTIRSSRLSDLIERNTGITGLPDNLFSTLLNPTGPAAGGTVAGSTVNDYAAIDGSNNNLANPEMGTVGTHMRVDYTQEYGDGVRSPGGAERPNTREISNALFEQDESIPDASGATGFMLAWSQFLGHDFTFSPAGAADTLKVYGNNYEGGGEFPFVAEKLNLMLGHEVYAGVNNVIDRPIFLPALDIDGSAQSGDFATEDVTVTNSALGAAVEVKAGTLVDRQGNAFTEQLSISDVPPELTPAALPEGLSPDLVVTIQPGDMVFNQPAPLTLANEAGWAPGTEMDLWSIDPTTGDFEVVGTGRVTADGQSIETVEGGIRNSSWHFFAPPPWAWLLELPFHGCPACTTMGEFNSAVEFDTGAVIENHNLATYQSSGQIYGVQLVYDSLRADARPIFEVDFGEVDTSRIAPGFEDRLRLSAELTLDINGVERQVPGYSGALQAAQGKHFWKIEQAGEVNAALQADLRDVESGIYGFEMRAGIALNVRNRLLGTTSAAQNAGSHFIHVNTVDSAFGSGWGIAGVQELKVGDNGSVLLIDGDGTELFFEAPTTPGGDYSSPPGDFSVLEKAVDGTFRRTTKDQTVYTFDANHRLVSVVDRNGNETEHVYNAAGQLTKIIDPADLETTFGYNAQGKVSTITDPANRFTKLFYDDAGNLERIEDPDETERAFEYDAEHHMVAETDKRGYREQAHYDEFGRATHAERKDGSMVQIDAVQTRGLYRAEQTASLANSPYAVQQQADTAIYRDGNGNVTEVEIDGAGQTVTTNDGGGDGAQIERDARNNLITQTLDARGNVTQFTYDSAGNLIDVRDQFSPGAGETPRSVSFDGDGDSLALTPNAVAAGQDAVTVEFWTKLNELTGTQTLYSETDSTSDRFKVEVVDGILNFGVQTSEGWEYTTTNLETLNVSPGVDLPDLVVSDIVLPEGPISWDESIEVSWTVTNQGTTDIVGAWYDRVFFSNDAVLDDSDRLEDQVLKGFTLADPFSPGESYVARATLDTFYAFRENLHVIVSNSAISGTSNAEISEENNTLAAPLNLTGSDLAVSDVRLSDEPATWGDTINVSWEVTNQGPVAAKRNWVDRVYLSDDPILDSSDRLVRTHSVVPEVSLAPGESYVVDETIDTTFASRDARYLIVLTDAFNNKIETNDDNNTHAIALNLTDPDLIVSDIDVPGDPSTWGDTIDVSWTVKNQGPVTAYYGGFDEIYFSDDPIFDSNDQFIFRYNGFPERPIAPGESYTVTQQISTENLPSDTPHIIVRTDSFFGNGNQIETNENNNIRIFTPGEVPTIDLNADLVVSDIEIPANATWGETVDINWTVTNQGTATTVAAWDDVIYLSDDEVLDSTDRVLTYRSMSDVVPLAAGQSYEMSAQVTLPNQVLDKPFLLIATDRHQYQPETNETNNTAAIAHNLTSPDLSISAATLLSANATWGETVDLSWTVTNQSNVAAISDWSDYIYASDDAVLDASDVLIHRSQRSMEIPLAAGESYTSNESIELPLSVAGKPYLLFATDGGQQQNETDETNNVFALEPLELGVADLAVTSFTAPAPLTWQGSIPLSWTVTNQSQHAAIGQWYDTIYASQDAVWDASDVVVAETQINRATPLAAGESYEATYDLQLPPSTVDKPYLFVVSNRGNHLLESTTSNNTQLLAVETGPSPAIDRWVHVAAVVDAQSGLQLYINGELKNTQALVGLPVEVTGGTTQLSSATNSLDGLIDEVRVWDQARDAAAIQADWRTTLAGDEAGLVAYWNFNGRSSTVEDATGQQGSTSLTGDVVKSADAAPVLGETPDDAQPRFTYDETFNQLIRSVDERGNVTLYELDDNGNRRTMTRVVGEVDSVENGESDDVVTTYTYTTDGVKGLLDTVTDALERVTDYNYDSYGRLEQIIFAVGTDDEAEQNFEYNDAGNLTAFIDENNNRTEYDYDALNRIEEIKEADPDGTEGPLTSPITTFFYDEAGNLELIRDARQHESQYVYDELNRLIEVVDAEGNRTQNRYDGAGNLVGVIDGRGHETRYEYDSRNRRVAMIDAEGHKTRFFYDGDNNLVAIVDALGNRTQFGYDARDRLVKETDALDQETIYRYDATNNLIEFTDRRQKTTSYRYDELNRLETVTNALKDTVDYGYDKVGNVRSITNERTHTTHFDYDARHRLKTVTDALEGTTNYTYDRVGNITEVEDELLRTTSYVYDKLNRLTQIEDPLLHSTYFSYDGVGNLTEVKDELMRTTEYRYDKLNRQIGMTNAMNDDSSIAYDAVGNVTAVTDELGRTTRFTYDKRNLQHEVIDALGHTTTRQYDAVGNVELVTDALGHSTEYRYDELYRREFVIDATMEDTQMAYDEVGNLIRVTDASNNVTTYRYDDLNRLETEEIRVDGVDLTRSYGYDAASNLTSVNDRNSRELTFVYDKLNLQTNERWLDGQGNIERDIEFRYDKASQLKFAGDIESAYAYDYDLAGRLVEVDNNGTPGVPNVVLTYGYDDVNNLTSVTDTIDGVAAGVETFVYDNLNRVEQITQNGNGVSEKRVEITYDKASQMIGVNRYSDVAGTQAVAQTTYDYDLAGRLEELTHQDGNTPIADYRFAYDEANRLKQLVTPDGTSNYGYNDRNELETSEHDYQGNEDYSYDATGNRTNTGYSTGDHNRLASDGTYTYGYDNEGNRTRRVEIATGEVTEYSWDYRNRLTGVETKASDGTVLKTVEYTYDVYDRRITKVVDADGPGGAAATEENYVYDGDHIALVFDEAGNQTHRYLHGPQVDQVLAQETADGETQWALTDHQGSVRDVIDNDGAVLNHITYDSFGRVTGESDSSVDFRFGYTGRELDDETGLMQYRARYYDPAVGQFINEDPLGFDAGDANVYRYVFNSPTNYTDPSGQNAASELWNGINPLPWLGSVGLGLAVTSINAASYTNPLGIAWHLANSPGFMDDSADRLDALLDYCLGLIVSHPGEFDPNRINEGDDGAAIPNWRDNLLPNTRPRINPRDLNPGGFNEEPVEIDDGIVPGPLLRDPYEMFPPFFESSGSSDRPTPTDRYKDQFFERAGKSEDESSLEGARIELQGGQTEAAIKQGRDFDHISKVRNAQRGLLGRIEQIKRTLRNPFSNLSESERQALQSELSEASTLLDYTEEFVPRIK